MHLLGQQVYTTNRIDRKHTHKTIMAVIGFYSRNTLNILGMELSKGFRVPAHELTSSELFLISLSVQFPF